MAWAIWHKEANWSRPKSKHSFHAKPLPVPQRRTRDFVEHSVAKGLATAVAAPNKQQAGLWLAEARNTSRRGR